MSFFKIQKKGVGLSRAGTINTNHGQIQTPSFVTVGTKATVKSMSPKQVEDVNSQVVLANTYHLYLQPGDHILKKAGGLHKYMNWDGPTMTDSGGFQAFSLGVAYEQGGLSKVVKANEIVEEKENICGESRLAKITEEGVSFKSHIDGSEHFFTPEKSMEIQKNIGADIIFAFDECTSPNASWQYQKEAMDRTHRWAKRSLDRFKELNVDKEQFLLGIVQGGRFEDLRKESAKEISSMDFDGFGIGGSFEKEDMGNAVRWINEILPEEKPRHLLGIGEPVDVLEGIENGCDLFDCVAPTRMARNGALHTKDGRINILNNKFREDFSSIEEDCQCYTCRNYTKSYLAHLFRAKEMFAATLASIHNLHFMNKLTSDARQAILDDRFEEYKSNFIARYYKKK